MSKKTQLNRWIESAALDSTCVLFVPNPDGPGPITMHVASNGTDPVGVEYGTVTQLMFPTLKV